MRTDYSDDEKWIDIKSILNDQCESGPFDSDLIEYLDNPKYSNIAVSDIPVRGDDDAYFWVIDSRTMETSEFLLVKVKEKEDVRVVIKEIMWITYGLHDNLDFEGIYYNATDGVFSL